MRRFEIERTTSVTPAQRAKREATAATMIHILVESEIDVVPDVSRAADEVFEMLSGATSRGMMTNGIAASRDALD